MSSSSSSMIQRSCGGYVDPGWEHGVAQDDRKKKVQCNYCRKVVSGGIYRLKQHLARLSGEVTCCDKVPDDVRIKMRDNLQGSRVGKKNSHPKDYDEQSYLNFNSTDDDEDHRRRKGKQMSELAIYNHKKKNNDDNNSYTMTTSLRSLGYVDPGWEHGVPQDDRKKKVKCNYCEKVVSGGINRFKQHLARIPGEVAPCKNVPDEVYLKIKENMKWHRTGRRHRPPDTGDTKDNNNNNMSTAIFSDNEDKDNQEEDDDDDACAAYDNINNRRHDRRTFKGLSSESMSKRPRIDVNVPKITMTPLLAKWPSSSSRREVISAMCKFFYHAGVPSHAANSPFFLKMLEVVSQYGSDLVGPSSHLISGRCLKDEVSTIKNYLVEYKSSWAVTGCSILADSWRDRQDRTLINILVSCPRGVYFVCSVDVSGFVDDANYLFKLLDKVVEEMGEENVVQVITQNTPSYRAAGKMLEERRRNLFWTPCAAYCIDQILEEFTKLNSVRDCMEKAQKITKFIYNRTWLLNLMKKELTRGAELLRPSITRAASSFTTLQSLLDHRVGLRRMFLSNKWISSRFSKLDEGKEVKSIVLDSSFWRKVEFVRRSVGPIVEVLQKINSDESLSMPFIYNDMYRAKLAIKINHNNDAHKYEPFWSVIDNHWGSLFHHPLYLAAYFLNPSYRYRPDFILHPDVVRGLNACIIRLEPDSARRISASMQISDFGTAKADFGTDLAMSTRSELDPAAWWQQHGINCLELQRIAVRILSQSCSSFGCEHNWSIHDQIYEQMHNRLAQKRLNEAIYVHYNLRLRERQMRKRSSNSVPVDSVLREDLLYDWIVETEKQALQEDEEIVCTEMEHEDAYESDLREFDDGNTESRKGAMEMVLTDHVVEPLDVEDDDTAQNNDEPASGDDDHVLNFIDDDDDDDDDDKTE